MYVFFKWQVSLSVSVLAILALYLLGIGSIPKFAVSHTPNLLVDSPEKCKHSGLWGKNCLITPTNIGSTNGVSWGGNKYISICANKGSLKTFNHYFYNYIYWQIITLHLKPQTINFPSKNLGQTPVSLAHWPFATLPIQIMILAPSTLIRSTSNQALGWVIQ